MRKRYKIFLFIIITIVISLIFMNVKTANAEFARTLHLKTKIFESSNEDYYIGCEDYADYEFSNPAITVLTHGLGGKYYHWSNDFSSNNGKKLVFNNFSIIKKLYEKFDGDFYLYYAQAGYSDTVNGKSVKHPEGLWFYRVDLTGYMQNNSTIDLMEEVDHINADKHIVILFNSEITSYHHESVYGQFHDMMDNISLQFYNLTGSLPKFNLIGHSRGGVINLMYATEHIYNVSSIHSMGTPYNGTTLGFVDPVMLFLEYFKKIKDKDNNDVIVVNPDYIGVEDILNEQVSIDLRNAWNDVYNDNINIDIVAYGSATSIDFLRELVDDIMTNARYSAYANDLTDYVDYINVALNVIDCFPEFANSVFNGTDSLIQITEFLDIGAYDYILSKVSANLVGQITAEEASAILRLFNVVNNEAVIMDDLFIDTNSQLGLGFSDGIEYEGFKREMKIFRPEDLIDASAVPSQPGIPHNLEIMNPMIIDDIVSKLEFGCFTENVVQITDGFNDNYIDQKSLVFNFSTEYIGTRKFTADSGNISLYKYVNDNLQKCEVDQTTLHSLQYEFEKGEEYLIIVENCSDNCDITFDIVSSLELKYSDESESIENVIFEKNAMRLIGIKVSESGYYYINTNNSFIQVTNGVDCGDSKYYTYLDAIKVNNIYLLSTQNTYISTSIEVSRVDYKDIEETSQITSKNGVVYFTNRFAHTLSFEIELTSNSTNNIVNVYDEESDYLTNITYISNSKYCFDLSSGESCYIVVSSDVSSYSFVINVMVNQFRWNINGVNIEGEQISLPRGFTYNVSLLVLNDSRYEDVENDIEISSSTGTEYTLSGNGVFTIKTGASINNKIFADCNDIGLRLEITIEDNFVIELSSESSESDAYLYYKSNKSSCKIVGTYSNTYGTYSFSSDATNTYRTNIISSYVFDSIYENPKNTTVTVKSIIYNGMTFNLSTYITYVVDVKFGGGNGTSSNPYQVNCFRHLNNIRYYNGSSYHFIQTEDILLERNEEWIPISSFSGHYDGDNYSILFLYMEVDTNSNYYGFIGVLNGTIENVIFEYSRVSSTGMVSDNDSSSIFIGIIAGYCNTNGVIRNCTIYSGYLIDSRLRQSYVGGICGYNKGTVTNCEVEYTFYISGYAGGIVGFNDGTINSCSNYSDFNYYWSDDNGYVGGIAGTNYTNGVIRNCQSVANYSWNSTDDSSGINPYVGGVIGYNSGAYSNCTCTNDVSEFNGIIKKNIFGTITYNQEKYCFAVDGGKVGYNK